MRTRGKETRQRRRHKGREDDGRGVDDEVDKLHLSEGWIYNSGEVDEDWGEMEWRGRQRRGR